MVLPPVEQGVQTWQLDSWTRFYELVATEFFNKPTYVFRGHANAGWTIKATLDRLEDTYPTRPNFACNIPKHFEYPPAPRHAHLRAFRQSMRGRPGVVAPPRDDNECWALAQHHGLATPMLDWTLSPFVALFFAFEKEATASERAVLAVCTGVITQTNTGNDPAPIPYLPANEASHRLLAQAGLFLKMPEKADLEAYVRTHFAEETTGSHPNPSAVLVKIHIRNDGRKDCLKMLNKMNINRMTLFPDLDGAAAYINALWDIDFDTSLGYIRGEEDAG